MTSEPTTTESVVPEGADHRPARRGRFWPRFSLFSLLMIMLIAGIYFARYGEQYRAYLDEQRRIVPTDFDITTGRNVLWTAKVGSRSYSGPVVSGGFVLVGTNNDGAHLTRYPASVDLGVMLCFRTADGKFLWQASHQKLPTGRVHDWPRQGVTSTPSVEGDRIWYVSNRCEVVCLDAKGFYDNQDDGVEDEFPPEASREHEADTVWRFDMMGKLGVSPHNGCCSTPAISDRAVFIVTGNACDETHLRTATPDAPSFLALDKTTGKVLWTDNSPGANVLHGAWGSATLAKLGGVEQVIFPGGDGWIYSFDPDGDGKGNSKLLWKFDCNPKRSRWAIGGRGTRNCVVNPVTVHEGRVYVTVGQDPEHGEGDGRVWCIDPTKRGDVSQELVYNESDPNQVIPHKRLLACDAAAGDFTKPNPNSAVVWCYTQTDLNADGAITFDEKMHRSLSRVSIKDDLALVSDAAGLLHCIDAKTGRGLWTHDLFAASWSTPLIAGRHVYAADEDGDVEVMALSADPAVALPRGNAVSISALNRGVNGSPTSANNVLYIVSGNTLYAIADPRKKK